MEEESVKRNIESTVIGLNQLETLGEDMETRLRNIEKRLKDAETQSLRDRRVLVVTTAILVIWCLILISILFM